MNPGDKCLVTTPPLFQSVMLADNERKVVTLIGIIPAGVVLDLPGGKKFKVGRLPGSRVWWEIEEELLYFMHGRVFQLPLVSSLYLQPLDHKPARQWFSDYFKKVIKV